MFVDDVREVAVHALARAAELSELGRDDLEELASFARRREYGSREFVWCAGDPNPGVCVIAEGSVRVYSAASSRKEATAEDLRAGQLFGLIFAVGSRRPWSIIEAEKEGAVIYHVPCAEFRRAVGSRPDVVWRLTGGLADRLDVALARVSEMREPAKVRVARELIRLGSGSPDRVVLSMHVEIAQRIGSPREVVSRAIAELKREGLVRLCPRTGHLILTSDERIIARYAWETAGVA